MIKLLTHLEACVVELCCNLFYNKPNTLIFTTAVVQTYTASVAFATLITKNCQQRLYRRPHMLHFRTLRWDISNEIKSEWLI